MDITVSSPGSPGTSFTENVKEKILILFDVLERNGNFASMGDLGAELQRFGINWNYARNILPFLKNCGIVKYQEASPIESRSFFTNIGYAYVDILRSIKAVKEEPESGLRREVLARLERIQQGMDFQCLVLMMKNPECNYGYDFFDVLCFVVKYGSIDSTEYLLIQHEREVHPEGYLDAMQDMVHRYRSGSIAIRIKTRTKNGESGRAKSVNSFPYVWGNFVKAGVFEKREDGRYYMAEDRMPEIQNAVQEVGACQNSVHRQSK